MNIPNWACEVIFTFGGDRGNRKAEYLRQVALIPGFAEDDGPATGNGDPPPVRVAGS